MLKERHKRIKKVEDEGKDERKVSVRGKVKGKGEVRKGWTSEGN